MTMYYLLTGCGGDFSQIPGTPTSPMFSRSFRRRSL